MKKIFSIFLAVCICLSVMTSCSLFQFKPKTANELWEKIDATMNKLNSYEADGTGKLTFQAMGFPVASELTMKTIVTDNNKKDFYYYSASEITVKMDIPFMEQSETTKSIEAFHNGKMFISTESADSVQKFCSSLTADEYAEYREKQSTDSDDIQFDDCTNAAFTHNEDETWTLSYSGYTKKTINQMMDSFGMNEETLDFDIEDMEITIQADKKFRVMEMKIKFVFDAENTSSAPTFEMTTKYSNYNEVTPITDTLNPDDYKEIEDCRLLSDFEDMIEKLEDDKDGSFVMEMEQTISVLGQKETYTETDTVSYGEKDGKYFYDVTVKSTSYNNLKITYENGTQTLTLHGKNTTQEQTETEARAFINDLINTAKYGANHVSDIKKLEDGVYEIQCDNPDSSAFQAVFEGYNGNLTSIQQILKITVKDGGIVKIENDTSAEGNVNLDDSRAVVMGITLHSTNTFNP